MLFHTMMPVILLSSLAFMIPTLMRSENSTAIILIIVALFFWLAGSALRESSWNLFHNPFRSVEEIRTLVWSKTTFYNRLYLVIGSVIMTLFGLLQLQKREKFI